MSKRMKISLITLVLVIGLVLSFGAGCTLATRTTLPSTDQGFDVVKEAYDIILQNYVEREKLDANKLREGAIKGMLEALDDPYSVYMSPKAYQLSMSGLQGKFEGIGATVGIRDDKLMIIAPIPDSPAARAGIKPGDAILEIDGQSTEGLSLEEAVLSIRGLKGTSVKLLIQHQGVAETEVIEIVRAEIKLTSVSFEMKGDIAYINITHFTERTDGELKPAIINVNQNGATGIVLDLRSNPGGLLDSVVDVASYFLKEGVVVSTVDNEGRRESLSVRPGSVKTDLPLVVLTDNYSASASEVLTGALQDYGRATIAGAKTFGKGSVNQLYRLKDGSGIYITMARWLTPNGRMIEGEGISPDYELELTGDDAIQWAIDLLEGVKAER